MSKVRGNVLNPIEMLEKYGTDALRFALSTGTSPGNDLKLSVSKLEASRNFANKLWNAGRYVIRNLGTGEVNMEIKPDSLPVEDRWILSRLSRTVASVTGLMDEFQFGEAQRQIHDFIWGDFCDWYIELSKSRLRDTEATSPLPVLGHILEKSLRLLHPYMPFVTEELWQNLRRYLPADRARGESIMIAAYPEADTAAIDPEAEGVMETLIEVVRAIRNARAQYQVENARWVEAQIYAGRQKAALEPYAGTIQMMARARPVTFLNERQKGAVEENKLVQVLKGAEVIIPMESMFDLETEKKRLRKEMEGVEGEIARLSAHLEDGAFLEKAPATVVEKEHQKLADAHDRWERLKHQMPAS